MLFPLFLYKTPDFCYNITWSKRQYRPACVPRADDEVEGVSKIRRMPSRCCHSAGRRKNTGDRATKSRPWITNRTDIPCEGCFLASLRDPAERNSLYVFSPLVFVILPAQLLYRPAVP